MVTQQTHPSTDCSFIQSKNFIKRSPSQRGRIIFWDKGTIFYKSSYTLQQMYLEQQDRLRARLPLFDLSGYLHYYNMAVKKKVKFYQKLYEEIQKNRVSKIKQRRVVLKEDGKLKVIVNKSTRPSGMSMADRHYQQYRCCSDTVSTRTAAIVLPHLLPATKFE